jgi:hypothetical protein
MTSRAAKTVLMVGLIPGVLVGVFAVTEPVARACGGFFCSTVPIDQSGEQIIFSVTPGHVTAVIQISYSGAAQDFAWVVPVTAKPDITLGSPRVFQVVGGATQPQFQLQWTGDGGSCFYRGFPTAGGAGGSAGAVDAAGAVTVLASQDVGPFMTVTLESHDSAQLLQWLNDNGFAQPAASLPLIDHYVQRGMLFVAIRLKQDASAGEILPVVLDMPTSEPCVPLILTRIAAQPNMPVQVYVLGAARAFPSNWFHVIPDLAKINWLQYGTNYRQVVTDAIDQAAGHGFVTEFAGASTLLKDRIWAAGQYDTSMLSGITDPAALVQALLVGGYPRDGSMQALLRKWIPMPAAVAARGITESAFYNNLTAYQADLDAAGFVLNTAGFIADLEERVVMPLQRAQAMVDGQPYLTRLLSTVSPDEMTRDPIFVLNGDLPDVSNLHVAKASGVCQTDGTVRNLSLQLEDGRTLPLDGVTSLLGNGVWPYAGVPAARSIELVGPSGAPVPVAASDVGRLDTALDTLPPQIVRGMAAQSTPTPMPGGGDGGCGCTLSPRGPAGLASLALAAVAGLFLAARRRRQRR